MPVVAAAMSDSAGRWLLQKRQPGKRHAGLWEFPGGKVERGETPLAALIRELNEELTITLSADGHVAIGQASDEAGEGEPAIVITLYRIGSWQGTPQPEPGAELGWFTQEEIAALPLPRLDSLLAEQLFSSAG